MHGTQQKYFDAFRRAYAFATAEPLAPSLINLPSAFVPQVNSLRDALARLDVFAVDQDSGRNRASTVERKALRWRLRSKQLVSLRKIALVIERTNVGMPQLVRIPKSTKSEAALVNAAKAILKNVMPFRALFIQKGLPDDFIEQLNAAIRAVEDAKVADGLIRGRRFAARGGISAAIVDGRDAVHCLDQIIRRACDADPVNGLATLSDWVKTKRVHHVPVAAVSTSVPASAAAVATTHTTLTLSEPVAEAA